MKRSDTSIQQKLMRVILITGAMIWLLISASYITYEFFTFRDSVLNQLSTEGKIIAANSTAAIAFQSEADASEILSALKAEKNIIAGCLYTNQGNFFATYTTPGFKGSFPDAPKNETYKYKGRYLEGFIPVIQDNVKLGTLYLQADMRPVYIRFVWYALFSAILFGGLTFFAAFYLSKRLQKNISAPILELAEKSKIISEKYDYSVRAKKMSNDELGLLTEAFNQMLSRIEIQNKEIAAFNQELEEKIKERTQQLTESNDALQRQNEFVQTILDSAIDIMAVYDTETRIMSFNKACENLYHFKKNDVLGKKYKEIFTNPGKNVFYDYLLKALQGEFIHLEKFKSPITGKYFESFFVPMKDSNNNVYAVFTAGHDITDIVEATEQLKDTNAALTKSNRDLEQFAYVASHDLQEPLRKIQIYIQMMEKNSPSDEASRKYFEKIKNAAQRMSELIRAVLEYSRLSKKEEQYRLVDLNEVLQNVKNDFELYIEEKKAIIKNDELPCINGIPLQMNQLFSNLINNALKFSVNNPLLEIYCKTIEASEVPVDGIKSASEYFEIKFRDYGIGFDAKNADRIFSIFQRLHTKDKFSGTGIGLALCKKIAENHNGFITADGETGKGAVFTVYLPKEELNETKTESSDELQH